MHDVLTGDILAHILRCIRVARDLASAGAACREWRVAADDPQLWRLLCEATWASSEGLLPRSSGYWRALYVQRSRPVRPPRPRTTLESCKLLIEVPGLLSRALPLTAFDEKGYASWAMPELANAVGRFHVARLEIFCEATRKTALLYEYDDELDDGAWEFSDMSRYGSDGEADCELGVAPLYDAMKDLRQNDDVSDDDDDDDEQVHMAWCTFFNGKSAETTFFDGLSGEFSAAIHNHHEPADGPAMLLRFWRALPHDDGGGPISRANLPAFLHLLDWGP